MSKFIRRSQRTVYENPWLRFEVHEINHPNGAAGEHGVVVPPLAGAVVVVDGSDVVLTRQERFGIDRSVLEIVKGGANAGETALGCAQRETREELGVLARSWEPMGLTYEIPSIVSLPVYLFLARDIENVAPENEEVESITVERLPFVEVLDAIAQGRINDAVTGTALFRAAVRLGYLEPTAAASASRSTDARADRVRD